MSRPVPGHPDCPRTIHVLREMVKHPDRDLHEESIALLASMTSGIGNSRGSEHRGSQKWSLDRLLEPTLFDGSILRVDPTESQWEPSTTLKPTDVRHLSEDEIVQHWDSLEDLWFQGIKRSIQTQTYLPLSVSGCSDLTLKRKLKIGRAHV